MLQYANTQQIFDVNLPYIAWSTDSVSNYLEDKPFGLLRDDEKARDWKATVKTVVELTPLVKQIPLVMPLVLKVPEWVMRRVSADLNRVLVMHKVSLALEPSKRAIARYGLSKPVNATLLEQGMQRSATRACANRREERPVASKTQSENTAYQAILNSSLPEQEKEPARLAQEILTLLMGGSATSSRVMTRITYHLASEQAMLARLREELITAMPDMNVTPPLEQLEKLPYLVRFQVLSSRLI